MPRRDDGNETPVFRAPTFGDISAQIDEPVNTDSSTQGLLPEFDFENLYEWCPGGLTPHMITGLLVRALSLHFSNPAYIRREELKSYIWHPTDSGIRIVSSTKWEARTANNMPAIVVRRMTQASNRIVMNDKAEASQSERGTVQYARMMSGTHQVSCLAQLPVPTELLSMEVFETLTWLSPIFRSRLPFHDFQVTGVGELAPLDHLGNETGVQIGVSYVYEYGWVTTHVRPPIRGVSITATT